MEKSKLVLALLLVAAVGALLAHSADPDPPALRTPAKNTGGSSAPASQTKVMREASRTNAGHRTDLLDQFRTSRDLASLLVMIRAQAEAGDALAERIYGQALEQCAGMSLGASDLEGTLKLVTQMHPESAGTFRSRLTVLEQRCEKLAQGRPILRSDVMDWYRRAASHGDPVAKAKTLTLSDLRAAKDADIQRSIKEILAAHDPESMLELANLMGQSTDARPEAFGKYSGSEMAADAWRIAACRMGADCSASSPLMILACLGPAACAGNTTPEMIQQNMLSPVAYREAEKMAAQIVADPGH